MNPSKKGSRAGLFLLLKPYRTQITWLLILTVISNGLSLILPKYIQHGIDNFEQVSTHFWPLIYPFAGISVAILIFTLLQNIVQTLSAERVAKDLRETITANLSHQPYAYLQELGASSLLTRLTSDVDAIKLFVSQVIVAMVSSLLLVIGSSLFLLSMNWRLALAVLATLPIIVVAFVLIFSKARTLFRRSQEVVDRLNQVINESILGSALIRVLNTGHQEQDKFAEPNTESRSIGLQILSMFASLIPTINFVSGLGTLLILLVGGHFVIQGSMTLGELAAFNAYLMMLIFPILVMGFTSNQMARASASYQRLAPLLALKIPQATPAIATPVKTIEVRDLALELAGKPVLKQISFSLKPATRTAVLGPTAAGKSVLVNLLAGLIPPDQGEILYDGQLFDSRSQTRLPAGIAAVFQDSVVFNLSVRENILFGAQLSEAELQSVLQVAELTEFVKGLSEGLDSLVSERGLSLSGGQKQRLMLARALAQKPSFLILDDFTARVDMATEQRILSNLARVYPDLTLLSVTQRVEAVKSYDHILLLMEGELIASGTHAELIESSPEYMQIYQSQRSTEHYELHT